MKPSYTDFDRVKCIASTKNQKHRRKPIRIADIVSYYVLEVRVGVIKIVIVINCNLITFSKVIACNCN